MNDQFDVSAGILFERGGATRYYAEGSHATGDIKVKFGVSGDRDGLRSAGVTVGNNSQRPVAESEPRTPGLYHGDAGVRDPGMPVNAPGENNHRSARTTGFQYQIPGITIERSAAISRIELPPSPRPLALNTKPEQPRDNLQMRRLPPVEEAPSITAPNQSTPVLPPDKPNNSVNNAIGNVSKNLPWDLSTNSGVEQLGDDARTANKILTILGEVIQRR